MWAQNTVIIFIIFAELFCFTTSISDLVTVSSPSTCVPNTRKWNPLNPQTFFHCTSTGSTLMRCPESMLFDPASSSCIRDVTPPSDRYPPNCARAVNGAYFPSYTDCRNFWRCGFQRAVLFTCGEGAYWSQKDLTCVYPEDANCKIVAEDDEASSR